MHNSVLQLVMKKFNLTQTPKPVMHLSQWKVIVKWTPVAPFTNMV